MSRSFIMCYNAPGPLIGASLSTSLCSQIFRVQSRSVHIYVPSGSLVHPREAVQTTMSNTKILLFKWRAQWSFQEERCRFQEAEERSKRRDMYFLSDHRFCAFIASKREVTRIASWDMHRSDDRQRRPFELSLLVASEVTLRMRRISDMYYLDYVTINHNISGLR